MISDEEQQLQNRRIREKANLKRVHNRENDEEGNDNLYQSEIEVNKKKLLMDDDKESMTNEIVNERPPKQQVSKELSNFMYSDDEIDEKERKKREKEKKLLDLLPQGFDLEEDDDVGKPKESQRSAARGIFVGDPEEFKGEMLTFEMPKYLKYCKVQLLQNYVKVEYGIAGNKRATDIEIKRYKDRRDAVIQAQMKIDDKLAAGYKKDPELFEYDFPEDELGIRKVPAMIGGIVGYQTLEVAKDDKRGGTKNNSKRGSRRVSNFGSDNEESDSDDNPLTKKPKGSNNRLSIPKKDFDQYSATSRRSSQEWEDYS